MDKHDKAWGDARLRTQPAGGINPGPRAVAAGLSAGGVRGSVEQLDWCGCGIGYLGFVYTAISVDKH